MIPSHTRGKELGGRFLCDLLRIAATGGSECEGWGLSSAGKLNVLPSVCLPKLKAFNREGTTGKRKTPKLIVKIIPTAIAMPHILT